MAQQALARLEGRGAYPGLGPQAVLIQARTFVRLCAGQIRDTRPCPPGTDPIAYYLDVLADKTGVLVATAARYGAMFSGGTPEQVEVLREYGELLGMAFQLADDIIDISSDGIQSGKTPGTDLREGVLTLPTLLVAASAEPEDARLRDLISRPLTDEDEVAEALSLLRSHAALREAREQIARRAEAARSELAPLPEGHAKDALSELCDQVVTRSM